MISPHNEYRNVSLHIFAAGAFGKAVATRLCVAHPGSTVTDADVKGADHEDLCRAATYRIVASWRPVPALCDFFNSACFQDGSVFIPLIMDGSVLRLGPVIKSGDGACWACWKRRFHQHDPWRARRVELEAHYESHPESGPAGYLDPAADIGAARVSQVISALASGREGFGGYVWQMDLLSRVIETGLVLGVHGCRLCGLGRDPETSTYESLRDCLDFLWEPAATDRTLKEIDNA